MFGDAELDDDDLYSMEHDNQTGKKHSDLLEVTGEFQPHWILLINTEVKKDGLTSTM